MAQADWHRLCLCPCEQAQPVPVGQAYWNRLFLSHWHKQAGCTKPVPLGLGEVKRHLSLCHGTSHIPTMEAIPCAMAQALYHDGACTCSTCANLCQKVGPQGRESFSLWKKLTSASTQKRRNTPRFRTLLFLIFFWNISYVRRLTI